MVSQENTAPLPPNRILRKYSWKAHEYVHHEKTSDWYWIVGILTVALIVIALLLNNLLFAIFILLSGFTVILYASRKPEILPFEANREGIQMKNTLYPYQMIDFYWIDETAPEIIIILELRKKTMPHIIMPLGDADPDELRDFLEDYIPEEYIERPWSQVLMDRIGF